MRLPRMDHRPSARGNAHPDPLAPSTNALAQGGALAAPAPARHERGVILEVDAARHVYRVGMHSGRAMAMGRIRAHPGDTQLLTVGTAVRVDFSLGVPYIDGVLPDEVLLTEDDDGAVNVTGTAGHGGEDPVLDRNYGVSARAPGTPRDILPGDIVHRSPDGAVIGAMHGKLALLQGSPLAQVRAFGDTDTVEIVAGLMRLVTWMGEARYVNDDGKTSFIWRGGADQLNETGADEERYTIRLDLGHTGDLARFEVTTLAGQPVFRMHVNPQGALEIFAAGGVVQSQGDGSALNATHVHGRQDVTVTGLRQVRVGGDDNHQVSGHTTTEVFGNATTMVGLDAINHVNRDLVERVGGRVALDVVGSHTTRCAQGDVTCEARQGHYRVKTLAGNIELEPTSGVLKVLSRPADGIELGRDPTSHATKFEELQAALMGWVADYNTFKREVAIHTHGGATSPTLTPLAVPHVLNLSTARSTTTKVK